MPAPQEFHNSTLYFIRAETAVLQTNVKELDDVFIKLIWVRSPELIIDEDFCTIDGERYYSFSGLAKFSQKLAKILPEYEQYHLEFSNIGIPVLEQLTTSLPYIPNKSLIDYMKKMARERDNDTCQVTRVNKNQYNRYKVDLVVHHLYDEYHYPTLAADIDNLITITMEVHEKFHIHFNGDYKNESTIDKFIQYISLNYYNQESLITELYERKRRLESKFL